MLKIKNVDVLSYDTFMLGFRAYSKSIAITWLVSLIPFGFLFFLAAIESTVINVFLILITLFELLLYFSVGGWVAINIYDGEAVRLFSRESFLVGWSLAWRYCVFFMVTIPILAIPFILVENLGWPKDIAFILSICLGLLITIIASGWSVKRVRILRQEWSSKTKQQDESGSLA